MQSASHFTKGEISPCGGYICSTVGLSGGGYKKIWVNIKKLNELEKVFVSNVRHAVDVFKKSSNATREYAQQIVSSMSHTARKKLLKCIIENPAKREKLILRAIPKNRLVGGINPEDERPPANPVPETERPRRRLSGQALEARVARLREVRSRTEDDRIHQAARERVDPRHPFDFRNTSWAKSLAWVVFYLLCASVYIKKTLDLHTWLREGLPDLLGLERL